MAAELATVLSYRPTDEGIDTGGAPAGTRVVARDPVILVHRTPAEALGFARCIVDEAPDAVVGIHVGELEGDRGPAVDGVLALVERGGPGEILVTDVVRQLSPDTQRFEPAGSIGGGGVGGRAYRLCNASTAGSPTVGRDVELASIDWVLEQLAEGNGRALVVEGEAGIGKSHLVSVAASRAEAMDATVVRAEADELQPSRPGLLIDRMLEHLDLAGASRDAGPTSVGEFCDLVQRAAARRPLLVVAEDLQWADPLSLRAVAALARAIGPLPIGLVVDFRPSPRPSLLGPLLDVLDRGGAEHHVLEPLDAESTTSLVAALLGAAPGPTLRARMLSTAGNPLFVTELLHALRSDDALHLDNGIVDTDSEDVPRRLHDTVRRRMDALPPATRALLLDASLLGSTFRLDDLETIAPDGSVDAADLLRPAVEARLLDPTAHGFAFRHDLVREAVHHALPEAVRARRHREIGWALAAGDAAPVVVASQLVLGDRPDHSDTLEWIERAARDARAVDPGSASELYALLLDRAPTSWPGRDAAETALVEMLAATGRVDEAIEQAHLLLRRPLDPHAEQMARTGLIAAQAARGQLERAAEEADRAAAASGDSGRELLLHCIAASLRFFDGRSTTTLTDAAGALADLDDDDERIAWAEQALGLAAMGDGRYEEARTHMVESRRRVDRTAVADLGFLIPHVHAPTMLAYLDDFDGQRSEISRAVDRWNARGETSRMVFGHISLMNRAYLVGDLDSAAAEAEAALSAGVETGADAMTIPSHAVLALVAIARGETAEAEQQISAGFEFLLSGAHRYGAELLGLAIARQQRLEGDPSAAAATLTGVWEEAGDLILAFQYRNLVPEVVRLREHGVPGDVVAAAVDAAARAAERTPLASTIGCSLRTRGLVDQDPDLLLEAASHYRGSPRAVERAETLEDAATALFRRGRSAEGATVADEAIDAFRTMGARADADRVESLARAHRAGGSTAAPAKPAHGWESLTPKELEVAEHVAAGLSNPEIGERLYISRRTVESHLSHIFTKLGIANRAKLSALVVERRPPRDP